MSIHQHIRFSVKKSAIEEVKKLIVDYAGYVADYAREHGEEWTWTTFQATATPTDFVSVISHEDADAEQRHRKVQGTKTFSENLYEHVTDSNLIALERIASSSRD